VSDEIPIAPVMDHDLDAEPNARPAAKSAMTEVADVLTDAARQLNRAFEAAQKPGMPLSVLSNVVREAPLGSLLITFMLGVVVGRRRAR
jgi:hypothetical protein